MSKANIDIGLHALVINASKHQTLNRAEIAEVCECAVGSILSIETRALKKAKVLFENLLGVEAIEMEITS